MWNFSKGYVKNICFFNSIDFERNICKIEASSLESIAIQKWGFTKPGSLNSLWSVECWGRESRGVEPSIPVHILDQVSLPFLRKVLFEDPYKLLGVDGLEFVHLDVVLEKYFEDVWK